MTSAPAMDEVPCHNDVNTFMDGLVCRRFSIAIFLTGTGTLTLLGEADRRGRLAEAIRVRSNAATCFRWRRKWVR